MTDTPTLPEWLAAQLDEDERIARDCEGEDWVYNPTLGDEEGRVDLESSFTVGDGTVLAGAGYGDFDPEMLAHIAEHDPARVLREVEAKRRLLAEHEPVLRNVEWPHDQTGDGHGWVCSRCQLAGSDAESWHPEIGQAGVFPTEDFTVPYVLAPCTTLLLLALSYSHRPGYREEWRP